MKNSIVIILILGAFISKVSATIWYVHPDSTLNSIQAALDSCSTNDTVLVGPGTYYENIVWPNTQGIDLTSEQGPLATVIDGDSAGRVITIATGVDSLTLVKGFTIQRGYTSDESGGGILCDSSSPYIKNNIITHNITHCYNTGGGGIACLFHAMPVICDNIISNNKVSFCGGGIGCFVNSNATITNNLISDNLAWLGGGVFCGYLSSPSIIGNTISGNVCHYDTTTNDRPCLTQRPTNGRSRDRCPSMGGGVCGLESSPSIINNIISGNAAMDGGGIGITFYHALIRDNIISGNMATLDMGGTGGGIYGVTDSLTIIRNTITGNEAEFRAGGIYVFGGSFLIDSCTIADNIKSGLICDCYCDPMTIAHSNISGNTGYAVQNLNPNITALAEHNWWGHATGPYHPVLNPGGLGDSVSDYVDFDPWLNAPVGVAERPAVKPVPKFETPGATLFSGPLQLPEGKECRVFDIAGRVVEPNKIVRGVYFIEVEGSIVRKVIKIR